jgi:hypothetical protein
MLTQSVRTSKSLPAFLFTNWPTISRVWSVEYDRGKMTAVT